MNDLQDIQKQMRSLFRWAMIFGCFLMLVLLYQSGVISIEPKEKVLVSEFEKSHELTLDGSIDEESGLILDNGFVEVNTHCGSCHSTELVVQNSFSREGWKDLIRWMQKEQNLWDLGEQEEIILSYLSKNYAPKNVGRRKPLDEIDWYVLKE